MNRITPTNFLEVYRDDLGGITDNEIQEITDLDSELKRTEDYNFTTVAIFLIAASDKTIEERMKERRENDAYQRIIAKHNITNQLK
jgi:hypothetical protein